MAVRRCCCACCWQCLLLALSLEAWVWTALNVGVFQFLCISTAVIFAILLVAYGGVCFGPVTETSDSEFIIPIPIYNVDIESVCFGYATAEVEARDYVLFA